MSGCRSIVCELGMIAYRGVFSGWESHTTLTDAEKDAEGAFPAISSEIV